jgi:mutator protein MutT
MHPNDNSALQHSHTPAPRLVEVAAGLIFRDGKLLVAQRHADAHLGGLWEFPGGKREPGETFPECLKRELREELGCEVEVLERVEAITHHYPDKSVHLEFFRCRWLAKEPVAIGCAAVRWVTREQLAEFQFPAADERLLARLRADVTLWA